MSLRPHCSVDLFLLLQARRWALSTHLTLVPRRASWLRLVVRSYGSQKLPEGPSRTVLKCSLRTGSLFSIQYHASDMTKCNIKDTCVCVCVLYPWMSGIGRKCLLNSTRISLLTYPLGACIPTPVQWV